MKTAPNTSGAISSNEKTFPIFARKLASGEVKDFTGTTYKLTVWLNSEKAYYAAARPKIVELLEIALRTFMDTFIHHPAVMELSEHLRRLIQVVIPFCHMFPEAELKSWYHSDQVCSFDDPCADRLQRVILDTNTSLSRVPTSSVRDNAPPQETVPAK
ncbi:hypothetical protein JVU11DRAFT_3867 [Chiua virens]|nr:hypothetical protein JVU11DRAFT_3867 [Chiua virens]